MKRLLKLSKKDDGRAEVDFELLDDEALVSRILQARPGDTRAFRELVHRHQGRIRANCRHLGTSADDAEDLAQEVFMKAYFGLPRYEGRARFRTWLHRIKINHCLNFLRSRGRRRMVALEDLANLERAEFRIRPAPAASYAEEQRNGLVRAVLESMPEGLRVPLVLCDVDGLSYQAVADSLGISLSAVRMRIKRGRDEFRRRYRARGGERLPNEAMRWPEP